VSAPAEVGQHVTTMLIVIAAHDENHRTTHCGTNIAQP
jgi:hypothetical protein